jgi:hypothetical protein
MPQKGILPSVSRRNALALVLAFPAVIPEGNLLLLISANPGGDSRNRLPCHSQQKSEVTLALLISCGFCQNPWGRVSKD